MTDKKERDSLPVSGGLTAVAATTHVTAYDALLSLSWATEYTLLDVGALASSRGDVWANVRAAVQQAVTASVGVQVQRAAQRSTLRLWPGAHLRGSRRAVKG